MDLALVSCSARADEVAVACLLDAAKVGKLPQCATCGSRRQPASISWKQTMQAERGESYVRLMFQDRGMLLAPVQQLLCMAAQPAALLAVSALQ